MAKLTDLTQVADTYLDAASEEALERLVERLGVLGKRWYSVKEAAIYMGRTEGAIRALQNSGKLPYSKFGGRVMFDRFDMDGLMEGAKR